ncbi:hypothetical protein ACLINQ_004406 [Vibrio parahaemolyticus]|uniref:hypothetical protein n=2 Tax=Vibrio parahaemolyticus TaxID=670 RepID=UPI00112376AC|nr:hypothetical protein [Vibrio parahaemolyticus]MBE3785128.1 hypothetical protein [Vibrio parahaemolyticus]TOA28963.1 hypothetical protein CGK29_23280 [Vibrio parahaemolyticus]HCG8269652.1 hypothetical protein [Vibrio parahaemolyticus]HCG8770170.1 hypothetical protein [Vibrio parahaemolyticus]HCM0729218.1 hypothetical protein [Vibrio parahaemolyticus]
MDIINILTIVLGSSVFAALITAIFTRKIHENNVSLKYITEERARWRQKIKELMGELSDAVHLPTENRERIKKVRSIATYLKLSLNPSENESIDVEIRKCLNDICNNPNYKKVKELELLFSKLLKHDWERAKQESQGTLSPLFLSLIFILLLWSIFEYNLKSTDLYEFLQSIPILSGNYTEIAVSISLMIIGFLLIHILVWCKNKWLMRKWKKT